MIYRNEKIRVFGPSKYNDYVVTIGDDCFEMSLDGYLPNGVNIYLGAVTKNMAWAGPEIHTIPDGLKRSIDARL